MGTDHAHPESPSAEAARIARVAGMAESLCDTLRTAEALATGRRLIDLGGLDARVRDLCANVLTLPPDRRAVSRLLLLGLLSRADRLLAALRTQASSPP
jgi:hypothetical protein